MRPKRAEIKVRVNNTGPLIENLPFTARAVLNALLGQGKQRSSLSFAVNCLPPTVNGMYTHTRFNTRLTKETKDFRTLVRFAIGANRFGFKNGGTVAVMMFLESPKWLTLKHTVREMDADNRVKPTLDAIKEAVGVPDETNWELHVWKVASKQTRTTVYLFDLGDVVDFHV
jgi:Holliday junction resolvase RusA-like endonuclease